MPFTKVRLVNWIHCHTKSVSKYPKWKISISSADKLRKKMLCCMDICISLLQPHGLFKEMYKIMEHLLKNKSMHCLEIMDIFHIFTQNMEPLPSPDDLDMIKQGLLCLAAFHGRMDIFRYHQPLKRLAENTTDWSNNPLLAAVAGGNVELIRQLVDAGYPVDTKCSYLKFTRNTSALDYAIAVDEAGMMNLLISGTKLSVMQLMTMVARHNAVKCFTSLFEHALRSREMTSDSDAMGEVFHAATSSGAKVLKQLIQLGYQYIDRNCNECCNTTPMHAAVSKFSLHSIKRELVFNNPQHFLDVSEILLAHGVKASVYNIHGQLPIETLIMQSNNIPITETIAQFMSAARILLSAMSQEATPGKELVVPRSSVITLHHVFHHDLFTADIYGGKRLSSFVKVLQMMLDKGVNLSKDEEYKPFPTSDRCNCGYDPRFSNLYPLFHLRSYFNAATLQRCMTYCQDIIEEPLIQFNTLLLLYGAVPDDSCFEYLATIMQVTTTPKMIALIRYFMTLMSEQNLFRFRQHLASRNVDVNPVSDKFDKSLKEKCLCALYANIRDRRMPAHVNSLPLPKRLKEYLVFDNQIKQ